MLRCKDKYMHMRTCTCTCTCTCRSTTNLNLGQDTRSTRADRTRHTSSSDTKPHAKHQHTNAHQTDLTYAHTPRDRRTMSTDTTDRPGLTPTHTQPPATARERERAPAWGTIACASSTDPSASASARRTPCRCCSSRTDLRHLQPTASKAPRGETGGRQEGPRRNSPLIRKPSLSRFCNVCNDASTPSEGA